MPDNDKNRQILEWVDILKRERYWVSVLFSLTLRAASPAHLQHTGDENIQSYQMEKGALRWTTPEAGKQEGYR